MKILNVNFSMDPKTGGGTAERTLQLSRFLTKNNVICTALTLNLNTLNNKILEDLQGVNIIMLPCLLRRFYIPFVSFKKLKAIVSEVDIIHLIGHWTLLNALVFYMARKLNKPYVFCPAGALSIFGRSKIIKKIYNWIVGNKILKNASRLIAITENEISLFQQYGVAGNKISLIPNGICVDDFRVKKEWSFSPRNNFPEKYLLFVGRLNYIKGPDLLLEAFAKIAADLNGYHLVFAGPDDGMLQSLENKSHALHLQDRVHFVGYVEGQEKAWLYSHASLLVIPSRQEAMSIVVLEGGVLGKPVLMTDQCGFSEVAAHQGGMVVPASAEGLEIGLRRLLLSNLSLEAMGKNLQQHIFDHYSWDFQISKLIKLYRQIIGSDNRDSAVSA